MSRQRIRRPLSVQSLETRKMMAADGFGSGGGILNVDGTPTDAQAGQVLNDLVVPNPSNARLASANETETFGDHRTEANRFFDVFFEILTDAGGDPNASSLTDDGGFIEPFDAFYFSEAPQGVTVTINGVNDPPASPSVDADSADAVMARYEQIHSLISMTEGESNGI